MTDKAHTTSLRKLKSAIRDAQRHLPARLPSLFMLTDPNRTPDLFGLAHALPEGSGLIYRHFGAPDRYHTATRLSNIAKKQRLKLLIGNDPKLAMKVGAEGVHWSEARLREAKYWQNRFALMTCAAHSRQAISRIQTTQIDAAFVSTVFPSNSPSASSPLGVATFRQLCAQSTIPLYALGGVNDQNMRNISRYGGISGIEGIQAAILKTA